MACTCLCTQRITFVKHSSKCFMPSERYGNKKGNLTPSFVVSTHKELVVHTNITMSYSTPTPYKLPTHTHNAALDTYKHCSTRHLHTLQPSHPHTLQAFNHPHTQGFDTHTLKAFNTHPTSFKSHTHTHTNFNPSTPTHPTSLQPHTLQSSNTTPYKPQYSRPHTHPPPKRLNTHTLPTSLQHPTPHMSFHSPILDSTPYMYQPSQQHSNTTYNTP